MTGWLRRYWRIALASVGGVVLVVLGTLGLAHLYRQSHEGLNWQAATQTVLTLVLVGVTAWYARLTGRMVDIQAHPERQIALAAQHAALGEVIELLSMHVWKVGAIARAFPVNESTGFGEVLVHDVETFTELVDSLSPLSPQLPTSLSESCEKVIENLRIAALNLGYIQMAILIEQDLTSQEMTWDGVRSAYNRLEEYNRMTWEEACAGKPYKRAHNLLALFTVSVRYALSGPVDARAPRQSHRGVS